MPELSAMRQGPLDHLAESALSGASVSLRRLPPSARFVLRCPAQAIRIAGQGFGVELPTAACRAAVAGSRAALWLGPDEWLLLGTVDEVTAIVAKMSEALAAEAYSIVYVGHRYAGITVEGPQAATLLNHGCPLDLFDDAFPVGMCTRTLFAKAEIVLWRTEGRVYRIEVERSFAPYVWQMLMEAGREFANA